MPRFLTQNDYLVLIALGVCLAACWVAIRGGRRQVK